MGSGPWSRGHSWTGQVLFPAFSCSSLPFQIPDPGGWRLSALKHGLTRIQPRRSEYWKGGKRQKKKICSHVEPCVGDVRRCAKALFTAFSVDVTTPLHRCIDLWVAIIIIDNNLQQSTILEH